MTNTYQSSLAVLIDDINRSYAGETIEAETYGLLDVALAEEDLKQSSAYGKAEAFFQGAFGCVLARYRFQQDATFVTIYHGRNDARLARSVGMFVKTLPVRVDCTRTAPDYFHAVRDLVMGSMDHDVYPFSEISRAFDITPTTLLAYQGANFTLGDVCGKPAELIVLDLDAAKEPLSLSVSIQGDAHVFDLQYRADLYDEATMAFFLDNLEIALAQLVEGRDPADVHLLFDEATHMVDIAEHAGKTFVDLFAEAAAAYPDRVAVRDDHSQLTYAELDRASAVLAGRLRAGGFGPEQFACVLSGRVKEFMVGVLGIMRAGGAYVPMDPAYPTDRLLYMLENSGADHLLLTPDCADLVGDFAGTRIDLTDTSGTPATREELDSFRPKPENLAYMIYTSGSTGKPKGVMIEHHSLMSLIEFLHEFQKPTPDDLYGEFSSFCFDASVIDCFVPLTVGAGLYFFAADVRQDAIAVCQVLKEEPITISTMPTQMGELVIDQLKDGCALRLFTLGGEKFKRFYDRPYTLVNGYGPTENTVESTMFIVDRPYDNIPIGKAIRNTRCYVVDENMRRVPVGVAGELVVAGRQVARGYHKLPEKTAAAFQDNPFATSEDERTMYRTGDMVRMLGDGNLLYIGRIDNQVKIRGYRVELGEIEGAMLKHDGLDEVAVVAADLDGTLYIVAYWTGVEVSEREWKDFLQPLIPDYMMPSFFVHLDAMPVTSGGKIDRRALPAPAQESSDDRPHVAPTSETESQIADMFAKALGRDRVSIDDDFFELGGTSLSASKVAVMCFNQHLPIVYADLFEHRTVRELAKVVEDQTQNTPTPKEVPKTAPDATAPVAAKPPAAPPATAYDLTAAPDAFDYAAIDALIAQNCSANVDAVADEGLGDVLLCGATGFLGIHVLRDYLENHEGRIWCLVRKGNFLTPERRLANLLMYYFERPYTELFGERILCIDADISDPAQMAALDAIPFRTLVNCAACVKHFAAGDELERANVQGVQQLVDLCARGKRRLVHISTISTAGESINGNPDPTIRLTEDALYFGQKINNAYVRSKFLSERAVLQAVAEGRIEGKVIRVGNLMSRASDGEFQINSITNGF